MPSLIAPLLHGASRKALLQHIDYLETMIALYADPENMSPGHDMYYRAIMLGGLENPRLE